MDMNWINPIINGNTGLATDNSIVNVHGNQLHGGMKHNCPSLQQGAHLLPQQTSVSMFDHPQYDLDEISDILHPSLRLGSVCNNRYTMHQAQQYFGEDDCQMGLPITSFASWHSQEAANTPLLFTGRINSLPTGLNLAIGSIEQARDSRAHQGARNIVNQMADLQLQPMAASQPNNLFCNFCAKSRQHRAKSRSHNLRDANGNIACVVLLNYTCPICKLKGHTAKYCSKSVK